MVSCDMVSYGCITPSLVFVLYLYSTVLLFPGDTLFFDMRQEAYPRIQLSVRCHPPRYPELLTDTSASNELPVEPLIN